MIRKTLRTIYEEDEDKRYLLFVKKVVILTLPFSANYGNRLQNYAVQQLLRSFGMEVQTIRNTTKSGFETPCQLEPSLVKKLHPTHARRYLRNRAYNQYGLKNDRDFRPLYALRGMKRRLAFEQARKKRTEAFRAFDRKYIAYTEFELEVQRIPFEKLKDFDCFICGSDQVWNPFYPHVSPLNFLDFVPKHKRIALSPSFGVSVIPDNRKAIYAKMLANIPHLSVREQTGADIIKELTGLEAQVFPDPTLLIAPGEWRALARKPSHKPESPYVLCYFLGNKTKNYSRYIRRIADTKGLVVVDICDAGNLLYYSCDPTEFLYLVDHASLVCTDSFHGTVFSILMRKPFVAFDRMESGSPIGSRLEQLLNRFSLQRRFGEVSDDEVDTIDFEGVDSIIQLDTVRMMNYLKNAFGEVDRAAVDSLPNLAHHDYCAGCAACIQVCPVQCIAMQLDGEGFFYPEIDLSRCIRCSKCVAVCPVLLPVPKSGEVLPDAFAAYANDPEIRAASSSGGLFSLLASRIIARGGVVFGAGYEGQGFFVRHQFVEKVEDLSLLRTSKYVQSDVSNAYGQAKGFLDRGRAVYFSGTPCQTEGLLKYLDKGYERLFVQDIICHGCPSQDVFNAYLSQVHEGKVIRQVNFRDKTRGWNEFCMKVSYTDGEYVASLEKDAYLKAYLADLCLRPSCYRCSFKTARRASDLTLADYWSIERVHPEMAGQKGVSLVLLQSEKGKELFAECAEYLTVQKTDCKKALGFNPAMEHSVAFSAQRKDYLEGYSKGFARTTSKLTAVPKARQVYVAARRGLSKATWPFAGNGRRRHG